MSNHPSLPSLTKSEWPVHITDALGLPAVQGRGGPWISTGDTTDLAWFHAMCDFLGVHYPGERIRAMRVVLEAAGGTWDQGRHSSAVDGKKAGGNVRKEAFEDLWLALHAGRFLDADDDPSLASDALTHGEDGALPSPPLIYQQVRLRQGQPAFRRRLLAAYGRVCAITGSDVEEILEAAHITSHAKGGRMVTSNGILLRADLHTLFDLRLIAIDTATWRVVAHDRLLSSSFGQSIHGRAVSLPIEPEERPSKVALDEHRRAAGL